LDSYPTTIPRSVNSSLSGSQVFREYRPNTPHPLIGYADITGEADPSRLPVAPGHGAKLFGSRVGMPGLDVYAQDQRTWTWV
jgi:hypothetical protein